MSSTNRRTLPRDLAVALEERDRFALENLRRQSGVPAAERTPGLRMLLRPTPAMPLGDLDTVARVVRWDHRPDVAAEFSASEFVAFLECPWIHHHRYRSGISTTTVDSQRTLEPLSAPARGMIIHDFLRFFRTSWDEARQIEEMSISLRRYARGRGLYPTDDDLTRAAASLVRETAAYRQSEWPARIEAATHARREAQFVFEFDTNTTITGVLDVILKEDDGWRVIDYKTAAVPAADAGSAIQRHAWRYEIQAAVYALAVEAMHGRGTMREFVFVFPPSGVEIRIPATAEWLASWRVRLTELIRRMRRAEYADPVWEENRCSGCEFVRLCLPAGRPVP